MGQYFRVVNLDKKEYINPHEMNTGAKLLEISDSGGGVAGALILLLRKSNECGGGDYSGNDPLVGSWAEDRIVVVGDYDESGLYHEVGAKFKEIGKEMVSVMKYV